MVDRALRHRCNSWVSVSVGTVVRSPKGTVNTGGGARHRMGTASSSDNIVERMMKIDLSDNTAIVTGSTAGIGFAIAKGLAEVGVVVVVNGRSDAVVDDAVRRLAGTVLVNNVSIYGPQNFFDIPDAEWTRFSEVNVMSGVRLSRAYLPGMVKRNQGRVLFLSSESALNIPADMIHYGFYKDGRFSDLARPRKARRRHGRHRQRYPSRPDIVGWL